MEDFSSLSQVPGPSDSPSPLSEPPDIRNWFSSYVYESFPLDSLVKESESEEDQFCVGETDKENVSVNFGSNKDCKPGNRRLSQDPDGKLSDSLPSEPPDIGNWFSSYVYESPVLDTSDVLVLSLSGESERVKERESKKDIEKEATKVDRSNVSPLKFEHEPFSSAKVTDFSHSPSLLSEPPDVRMWFSSYEYESPQLSEFHELGFASPEKDKLIIEESDEEDENSSGIFRKTRSKQEIIVPGRLKSNGYKEDISKDMAKDSSEEKDIGSSSDIAHSNKNLELKSTSFWIASTEELKQEPGFNHGSFPCEPKQEPSFSLGISPCNPKPQSSLNHEASLRQLKTPLRETFTMNFSQKSPRKTTQKARLGENSGSRTAESDNKENIYRESTATGFVTTKKDRFRGARERDSRTKPGKGTLLDCSKSKEWEKISGEEDEVTKKRRRVLGETTNINCTRSMEMTGKWACPQKNKPKLAPPLKQLRLDAWVHRV